MKKIIAALALTVGAIALAPTASADTAADAGFLNELDNQGIGYSSPAWIEGLAHAICRDMAVGTSVNTEATALEVGNARNGHYITPFDAGFIIGAAQVWYCPATSRSHL